MKRKKHIPAPGYADGLRGVALCGRYARYETADHRLIRQLARSGGGHWCKKCLRQLNKS
jgi:hypothetical protein